jgi:hypothetical protein
MKRFLKYIFVFLICLVILDIGNRWLNYTAFKSVPEGNSTRLEYPYYYLNKPVKVLVLGASRAQAHYNTVMLEDSLDMTCYNAGVAGRPIYDSYLSLLKAIENGGVKIVLLDLMPSQFSEEWMDERYVALNPFYWSNNSVREVVDCISGSPLKNSLSYYSSLIQYSGQGAIFNAYFYPSKTKNDKGYVPHPYLDRPIKFTRNKVPSPKMSKFAEKYLQLISKTCQSNNIQLYLCISPSLHNVDDFISYVSAFTELQYGEFLNLAYMEDITSDLYLWNDSGHLNSKGADLFTIKLVKLLKESSLGRI